ncbi:hypothetical protein MKX01_035191 [Papaver californicum]|nr:hypothetical protein MKX01_035191 [Papaver californicum]
MKKLGCEIEAIGINYSINAHKNSFCKILNSNQQQQQQQRQHDQVEAAGEGVKMSRPETVSSTKQVLKDVNCHAKPWEILAIVGPSGAGKSTLLEVLAGRLTPQTLSIFVDQKPFDRAQFKKISGYVTQKDTLFPLLTVEETLMFSAELRLTLPPSQLNSRIKALIEELGLSHVAKTRVGDDRLRGVSGGERRRVSIGVDVIHDPRVLILDEPTSGLDSTSALQIMDMLKIMAETRGRTVILTIHQPGFRIVNLFNSLLLLANGSVLHHGSADQLQLKLRSIGLQLPLHVNVVDFAIDSVEDLQHEQQQVQLVSIIQDQLQLQQKRAGDQEIDVRSGKCTLQQLFQQSKVVNEEVFSARIDLNPCGFANSRLREVFILTHRFAKNVYRNKELFTLLGSIFYDLKDDLTGSEERVGLFAFVLIFLLSCTTEALPIFLQEREILMKEISSGSYRVSSYRDSKWTSISTVSTNTCYLVLSSVILGLNRSFTAFMYFLLLIWLIFYTANSVVICFSTLVPNFIVGNSIISGSGMPNYWVFMHYISLFKYPFEGLLINEFSGAGKYLDHLFGACIVTGEDVLKEAGFGEGSRWRNVVIMICFILFYRFMSYIILRCRCSQKGHH